MSYIEQKIAAVLRLHVRQESVHKVWCTCGEWEGRTGHAAHAAAELVKSLGLVQFYSVAYGDGGMSEETYEYWDQARDVAAEAADAGYPNPSVSTAWFTGWEPAENVASLT